TDGRLSVQVGTEIRGGSGAGEGKLDAEPGAVRAVEMCRPSAMLIDDVSDDSELEAEALASGALETRIVEQMPAGIAAAIGVGGVEKHFDPCKGASARGGGIDGGPFSGGSGRTIDEVAECVPQCGGIRLHHDSVRRSDL